MALHQETYADLETLTEQLEREGRVLDVDEQLKILQVRATLAVAEQLA